jgi:6-pyruvoyltetrahydropterin/6-carboxytetrahydropterin synthase
MSWEIDKKFYLEYGHRVWSQELNHELCAIGDTACACRHLHGHSGMLRVFLKGDDLTRGMVTDFKHLGWMKDFIDKYLDHKMMIDMSDPGFESIVGYELSPSVKGSSPFLFKNGVVINLVKAPFDSGWIPDMTDLPFMSEHEHELIEGFFFVNFLPTSENLAKYIFDIATKVMKGTATVSRVEWNETPKSRAIYSA